MENNTIGNSWKKIRNELFSEEEITESYKRMAAISEAIMQDRIFRLGRISSDLPENDTAKVYH